MNAIVQHVIAQTIPQPAKGLEHAGNWPSSAEYGVEYTLTHTHEGMQYPGPTHKAFFESFLDYVEWVDTRRSWINATKKISMDIRLFQWDLGPNCMDYFTL